MGLTWSWEGIWGCPGNWSKKKLGGRDVEVDYDRSQTMVSVVLLRVKILGGCKKGCAYTTLEEMIGYRTLFPCILGREIRDSEN